jgi:[ribosomal protein S5]-alanine N-acetyltransferase
MTLQTPRLVLRELCPDDAAALNEIDADTRVTRFLSYEPQSPDQTHAYIERAIKQQSDNPRLVYDFAIVPQQPAHMRLDNSAESTTSCAEPSVRPLIGRCGLGIQRPDHREAMLWYLLHPAHWGNRYALEAASALVTFAFTTLGLHRVWADCDPRNTASCSVAQRLGMTLEGRLRENWFLKGEWCNTSLYAILENEWPARSQPP